jgi:hypothetical protein
VSTSNEPNTAVTHSEPQEKGIRTNRLHRRIWRALKRVGSETKPGRGAGDAVYALGDVEEGVQDEEGQGGAGYEGCHRELGF